MEDEVFQKIGSPLVDQNQLFSAKRNVNDFKGSGRAPLQDKELSGHSRGQVKYGEKLIKGQLRPHKGELAVIHQMQFLRASGESYGRIVNWLNSKQVATKNRVGKWGRPTVFKILSRQNTTKLQKISYVSSECSNHFY